MEIGLVGLGKMGSIIRERLIARSLAVTGYDRHNEIGDVSSLEDLVGRLTSPRTVWVMVPAGEPTRQVIESLAGPLEPGDLVIDGGNSYYRDSIVRAEQLSSEGIAFLDAGVSGGVRARDAGFCLMVGGDAEHFEKARPIFEALAQPDGLAHMGPVGSGHYTKMVHNGIEYGLMQSYAEGFELLAASGLDIDPARAVDVWMHGSVIRSWLLDLLGEALAADPGLSGVEGWVDDSGEGRWTVQDAIDRGVPVPAISAALFARFVSRQEDSPAMKAIAALRNQFGGHEVKRAGSE